MKVQVAKWEEHKEIAQLSKSSKYSKGFLDMYYLQDYYKRKEVYIARKRNKLLGFIAVRHCVNKPYTSVYYMGVAAPRQGVGRALIDYTWKLSSWKHIRLITEKSNEIGKQFYTALNFEVTGEGVNKQNVPYWVMEKKS